MSKILISVLVIILFFNFSTSYANAAPRDYASDSADMVIVEVPKVESKFNFNTLNILKYVNDQIKIMSLLRLVNVLKADGINRNEYLKSSFDKENLWLENLTEAGELAAAFYNMNNSLNGEASKCMQIDQKGICYSSNGSKAMLLTKLNYGPTNSACPNNNAFFLWDTTTGGRTICLHKK